MSALLARLLCRLRGHVTHVHWRAETVWEACGNGAFSGSNTDIWCVRCGRHRRIWWHGASRPGGRFLFRRWPL